MVITMNEVFFPNIISNIDGHDQLVNPVGLDYSVRRTIYVFGEITDLAAMSIISQLRYLDNKSEDDIIMLINSPGGSVTAGMAIYDMIKYGVKCDVVTVAIGVAASMGAFLLASGTKGKRYASPSTEIMIHQPLGGVQGQATDISLVADHIQNVKIRLAAILAERCGKTEDAVLKDMERDNWKTSEQAKLYGIIDYVGFPDGNEEEKYD